ncbi:DNA polymerase IV [Chromobacterium sp. IIBBL 290-4]|uniref:DNA polymerase IV n=1 Tax=Chromobacterium sp. IIBBL 290-4 TaxID=2953890 RepID=UPI0020B8DA80|nr:DNA polymerase IV [Chromobacterium sp. IIBBL 290-4]UTH75584.1 DNA polymerase IV [Chromobacterium sp. IIBBL 290-4]
MNAPQRKIIHVDCDCFYAAIEMRDDPSLRELPLAVGGRPETRGVIATCNYVARRFGVHSAMSSARALRLCPELVILPPDMARYRLASQQIMAIYLRYTELIEPLSLDEAYLDVTGQPHEQGSATLMAEAIRRQIRDEVGITASAGIAPNKFLAKVASDWNKPDGQFLVRPRDVDAFVAALPVEKVHGVGRVTAERLHKLGIHSCGDLRRWPAADLFRHFGRFGEQLLAMALGRDERPVSPDRSRKSISVEETYAQDLPDLQSCLAKLPELADRLQARLARNGNPEFKGLSVKLKFDDFSQTTVEQTGFALSMATFGQLLRTGHARGGRPVRLLGVGVKLADEQDLPRQLRLFDRHGRPFPDASPDQASDVGSEAVAPPLDG